MHPPLPAPGSPDPASVPARALAPDLARGLMLLLIAVANSTWYLWGHPTAGLASVHPNDGTTLDRAIRAAMAIAVDGRIYPLFALMFGYGMVQFARSRAGRGVQPGQIKRMLKRRHAAMLLIGFAHALLLFGGDILGAYALLGLILVPTLFEASVKTLRIVFWVLVAYAGVGALASLASGLLMNQLGLDMTGGFTIPPLATVMSGVGNYLIAMAIRVGVWLVATPGIVFTGIVPAAVLMGWLMARYQVLEDPARFRARLVKLAAGGIAVGWLTGVPTALGHLGTPVLSPNLELGYANVHYLGGLAAGVGYAALFGLIAGGRTAGNPVTRTIAGVGQRSLTFYLLQSVIFAPLLAAWGLGLGRQLNTAGVVAIALGIWALSLVLAAVLNAGDRRGPAEILLRRLTYLPPDQLIPAPAATVTPMPGPPPPPGPDRPGSSPGDPGASGS